MGFETNLAAGIRREGEWRKNKRVRWLGKTESMSGSIKTALRIAIDQGLSVHHQAETVREEDEYEDDLLVAADLQAGR